MNFILSNVYGDYFIVFVHMKIVLEIKLNFPVKYIWKTIQEIMTIAFLEKIALI